MWCPQWTRPESSGIRPGRSTDPLVRSGVQRLEASLANTGQILTRLGHHSYRLGPRPGLVNDREIARCLRHDHEALGLTAAAVLHCALTRPPAERIREVLRSPGEHAAAERLIAAGLLEDDHGVLRPTPRAEAPPRAAPVSPPVCSRLALTEARNRSHLPAQTALIVERRSNDSDLPGRPRAAVSPLDRIDPDVGHGRPLSPG
jgi:hypothetical protein